jgi:hypothetical protein
MIKTAVSFAGCVSSRVWPCPSSRIWPHFRAAGGGELWLNSCQRAVSYAAHSGMTQGPVSSAARPQSCRTGLTTRPTPSDTPETLPRREQR